MTARSLGKNCVHFDFFEIKPVMSPAQKGHQPVAENQRRATKIIRGTENLSHKVNLIALELFSLER